MNLLLLLLTSLLFYFQAAGASFVKSSHKCPANQYWCQDRCGTPSDTCCQTPDKGRHNLCGAGTICCRFGCCPADTTCNSIGACVQYTTTTDSHGKPTTITSTVVGPTGEPTGDPGGSPGGRPSDSNPKPTTVTKGDATLVIVGPKTATLPSVTKVTVITTLGQTITVSPTHPKGEPVTKTFPNGETMTSSQNGVVVIGTKTATLPSVTHKTVITTIGHTFTLTPSDPPPSDSPVTKTFPDGHTEVVVGSKTATLPIVSHKSTITTLGHTFTLLPPSEGPSGNPVTLTTLTGGQTVVSSSDVIIIGPGITIPIPKTITTPKVVTTKGVTWTFTPSPTKPDHTTGPPDPPKSDESDSLTKQSTWPPVTIVPIKTPVPKPESDDKGTKLPCKVWFFFVCISRGDIQIGGWEFPPLPPGIYPPGPPPVKFPEWIKIKGTLPPWPEITIGKNGVPTYTPTEEPTSCETETATLAATTTSYGVSTSGKKTVTTTSKVFSTSVNIVGCNVQDDDVTKTKTGTCTSTTTVAAAPSGGVQARAPKDGVCVVHEGETHIIYPKDSGDKGQTDAISAKLKKMVDPSTIENVATKCCGIVYWSVKLTSDQVKKLKADGNVMSVFTPCSDDCEDPTSEVVKRPDSPDTLIFVDQAPDSHIKDYKGDYYFEESAGEGVDVYVLDSGADMSHPEFSKGESPVKSRVRRLRTQKAIENGDQEDFGGHGTSMLSQVAGYTVGVAKKVTPIVVQIEFGKGEQEFLAGLAKVLDDVQGKPKVVRVLSMSLYYDSLKDPDGTSKQASWLLGLLAEKNVFPITGSGNSGKKTIDGIPAIFGASNTNAHYVPQLLVVGAVGVHGEVWPKSNSDHERKLPMVYAVGWDSLTANKNYHPAFGEHGLWERSGTSLATAQTAGLAAYLIALSRKPADDLFRLNEDLSTPQKVKDYIVKLSWARVKPYNAIFNGLEPLDMFLSSGRSCRIARRDIHGREIPNSQLEDWPDCKKPKPTKPGDHTTLSTTTSKKSNPTGFKCTSETVDQCAPDLVCHGPEHLGCKDGKCVCIMPDPPTPTGFTCTSKTVDQCAPEVICHGREHIGCKDGKCVCLSDPPTSTSSKHPKPTCDDKCKLDKGNACNCKDGKCDDQSPSCCNKGKTCPKCECGESGCSEDSPACCANGTCKWESGGGDGGDGGDDDGDDGSDDDKADNGYIIIAFKETSYNPPQGLADWYRYWIVFSGSSEDDISVCGDDSVESEETDSVTGNDPGYPFSIGPFEAEGIKCKYVGDEDKVGHLECDGKRRDCKDFDHKDEKCGLFKLTTITKVVGCAF